MLLAREKVGKSNREFLSKGTVMEPTRPKKKDQEDKDTEDENVEDAAGKAPLLHKEKSFNETYYVVFCDCCNVPRTACNSTSGGRSTKNSFKVKKPLPTPPVDDGCRARLSRRTKA